MARDYPDYERLLDESHIYFTTRIPPAALPYVGRLVGRHIYDRGGSPEDATRAFLCLATAVDGKRTQELIQAIGASVPKEMALEELMQSRIARNLETASRIGDEPKRGRFALRRSEE